jgi:hypothetical protein
MDMLENSVSLLAGMKSLDDVMCPFNEDAEEVCFFSLFKIGGFESFAQSLLDHPCENTGEGRYQGHDEGQDAGHAEEQDEGPAEEQDEDHVDEDHKASFTFSSMSSFMSSSMSSSMSSTSTKRKRGVEQDSDESYSDATQSSDSEKNDSDYTSDHAERDDDSDYETTTTRARRHQPKPTVARKKPKKFTSHNNSAQNTKNYKGGNENESQNEGQTEEEGQQEEEDEEGQTEEKDTTTTLAWTEYNLLTHVRENSAKLSRALVPESDMSTRWRPIILKTQPTIATRDTEGTKRVLIKKYPTGQRAKKVEAWRIARIARMSAVPIIRYVSLTCFICGFI